MTVDEIPVEQLTGPAAVIDVSAKVLNDRDYLIQIEDVISWESTHGRLPDNVILLFRTGFGKYWPDAKLYLGTDQKGPEAIPELHFPGIGREAAQWLADNRSIDAIGIDTASIDYGQSKTDEAHRILYELNIPGLEHVANLDMLPETGAFIIALPMKIKGGSGGPLRITAFIPD
jgi:kynurenine formamidase